MNGFVKSCALALAACLLAGCAPSLPSLPPQPTLDELLAEINAAHQVVNQPQLDASQYVTRPAPDEETLDYFTSDLTKFEFDPDAEVTAAQAAEDVEYLFGAFRALYGPYDYFGGDETFGEHKAELLARLEEKELRGYEPDLWVPADEAEELAVKLMENLGAVQAEGEASSPAA